MTQEHLFTTYKDFIEGTHCADPSRFTLGVTSYAVQTVLSVAEVTLEEDYVNQLRHIYWNKFGTSAGERSIVPIKKDLDLALKHAENRNPEEAVKFLKNVLL